jgi:hypothetical protein
LWLDLALILPFLYVCQIVPHAHAEAVDLESHTVPHAHGDHSHSAVHHEEEPDGLPKPTHHHDIAQHLDPHFLRILSKELKTAPDDEVLIVQSNCICEDEMIWASWDYDDKWVLDSIPTSSLDSRAPPVLI